MRERESQNPGQEFSVAVKRMTATLLTAVAIGSPYTDAGAVLSAPGTTPDSPKNNTTPGTMPSQEVDLGFPADSQQESKKQIVEFLTSPTPLPLPEVSSETVWGIINESENRELQPYRDEARERGIEAPAWNESCARVARSYDLSRLLPAQDGIPKTKGENKWQTNIERDDIFQAHLEQDKTKFILDTQGNPAIFLVQNKSVDKNNRAGKAFRSMIEWYQKNGVPNIVDILKANGMNLFCPITFDERGPFVGTYDEYGGFYVNMTKGTLKSSETPDKALIGILTKFSYVESIGIANARFRVIYGMGRDWFVEVASKRILASEACGDMYIKTGVKSYSVHENSFSLSAQDAADKVGLPLDTVDLQANIRFAKLNNLAQSLSPDGWKLETAED